MKKSFTISEGLFSASINAPTPSFKYQPAFSFIYEAMPTLAIQMQFAAVETRVINIDIIGEFYLNRGKVAFQLLVSSIMPLQSQSFW